MRFCKECKHMQTKELQFEFTERHGPLSAIAVCAKSLDKYNADFCVGGTSEDPAENVMRDCRDMRRDDSPIGNYCGPEGLLWERRK